MSPDSRNDLRDARDFYERQRKGLGRRFVLAFTDALEAVPDRPGSFPAVHLDVRRSRLAKFPYGIFFRPAGSVIRVIAVMHLHRDPRAWRRRA